MIPSVVMRLKGNIGRIIASILAVGALTWGYARLESTQNQLVGTQNQLVSEAHTRCVHQNAGYDSERNLLAYLKDRQVTVQASPLTPAQQANFDSAVALVPENEKC